MEPVGSLAGAWTFAEVLDFCRSLDLIYTIEVVDSQASLKLWLTLKPPASCMASQVIVIDAQEATILTWSCQYDVLESSKQLM